MPIIPTNPIERKDINYQKIITIAIDNKGKYVDIYWENSYASGAVTVLVDRGQDRIDGQDFIDVAASLPLGASENLHDHIKRVIYAMEIKKGNLEGEVK